MWIVIIARICSRSGEIVIVIGWIENIFTVLFVGKGEGNGLGGVLQHEFVETGNGEVMVRTLSLAGERKGFGGRSQGRL